MKFFAELVGQVIEHGDVAARSDEGSELFAQIRGNSCTLDTNAGDRHTFDGVTLVDVGFSGLAEEGLTGRGGPEAQLREDEDGKCEGTHCHPCGTVSAISEVIDFVEGGTGWLL